MTESVRFSPHVDFGPSAIIPHGMKNVPCVGIIIANREEVFFSGSDLLFLGFNLEPKRVFRELFRERVEATLRTRTSRQWVPGMVGKLTLAPKQTILMAHGSIERTRVNVPGEWVDDLTFHQYLRPLYKKNPAYHGALMQAFLHLCSEGFLNWDASTFTALRAA
jgi:hypothetical protein